MPFSSGERQTVRGTTVLRALTPACHPCPGLMAPTACPPPPHAGLAELWPSVGCSVSPWAGSGLRSNMWSGTNRSSAKICAVLLRYKHPLWFCGRKSNGEECTGDEVPSKNALEARCLKWVSLGSSQGAWQGFLLLQSLRENTFPSRFRLLEAACIPWLLALFCLQSQQWLVVSFSYRPCDSSSSAPSSSFKGPWWSHWSTWIIQASLRVWRSVD